MQLCQPANIVASLGQQIVNKHGLYRSLSTFLPQADQINTQLLTKRTYNTITESNILSVRSTKQPQSIFNLCQNGNTELDVKQVQNVFVNCQYGRYFGQVSKAHGKLQGHGFFKSKRYLILGSFADGKFLRDQKSVVYDKANKYLQVNSGSIVVRPNGTNFLVGAHYLPDGFGLSGLWKQMPILGKRGRCAWKLAVLQTGWRPVIIMPLNLKSGDAENFLDWGKGLTNPNNTLVKHSIVGEDWSNISWEREVYLGEWCRQTNEPHGRGIGIQNGAITISFHDRTSYGAQTGKYIEIRENRLIEVGEITFDGERKTVGMCYPKDGTSCTTKQYHTRHYRHEQSDQSDQ